jgi:7-cyano-7-deazaguanine synthase
MLSIAYGIAVAHGDAMVCTAVHGGDHAVYPDCRPEFIVALSHALAVANEGFGDPNLYICAPFINISKTGIVHMGRELKVPMERTWSCYKGGLAHCGKCGTCVERIEAFKDSGTPDPTVYLTDSEVADATA